MGISRQLLGPRGPQHKSAVAALAALWLSAAPASALELQLPIACSPGKDCFVQNYPDVAPGSGHPRDFVCGNATFEGLTGTDIRLLSVEAARGVHVLAAAAGVVRGSRDGMDDHLMRTPADKAAIAGKECGNGVAVEHGDGWETQYCHLRKGSVRVRAGDHVAAGTVLGEVGQSGETQFAHIHITVRRFGRTVDPFLGLPVAAACHAEASFDPASALWRKDVLVALGAPRTIVLEAGFSEHSVPEDVLEDGRAGVPAFTATSTQLVLFARLMHLRAGDRVHLHVDLPQGTPIDLTSEPETHEKAVKIISAIRPIRGQSWPLGRYVAHITVIRDGTNSADADTNLELR